MRKRKLKNTPVRPRAVSRYGWIPDLPDHRDILFGDVRRIPKRLPGKVDLRADCPPVEDQGQLGSCTANALVGMLEYLEIIHKVPFVDLSRLFVYYNERVIEHTVNEDSGAMLRDGIKTLVRQGVCRERNWPYKIEKFAVKPPASCYREALNHQALSYQRILAVNEMRACLADGFPFVFGFSVYESFESREVELTGIVPMPKRTESLLGGHAVLAVGYNHAEKVFIVRNSWGMDWGIKGYFMMPYQYLADRNLSDDFWTVKAAENL
jgi:C1A family cysteine protease